MVCTGLWTACADTPHALCATWGLACGYRRDYPLGRALTRPNFLHRLCAQETPPPPALHQRTRVIHTGDCDLLSRPVGRDSHNKGSALPFAGVVNVLRPMSSNARRAGSHQRMIRACVRHLFSALPSSGRQLTSCPLKRWRQRLVTASRMMPGPAARAMSSPGSQSCGRSWPSSTLRSRGGYPPMRPDPLQHRHDAIDRMG
jgi:hypothetical protein